MLEGQGYGKGCFRILAETLGDFLYRVPVYERKLESYRGSDGREIRTKLDDLLADRCALAGEYHRKRGG